MTLARREFVLSAVGLAGISSVSGCLSAFVGGEAAFLSYKAIEVGWQSDRGQSYVADLCWLWSDGRSRVFGWEPETYPDLVRSATEVVLTDETFQRLQDRFLRVELILGFSHIDTTELSMLESNLGQTAVSQERFNRIQFGDRITVAHTDSGNRIRNIETGGHSTLDGWNIEIGTKNLVEQFPDSDVPEPT